MAKALATSLHLHQNPRANLVTCMCHARYTGGIINTFRWTHWVPRLLMSAWWDMAQAKADQSNERCTWRGSNCQVTALTYQKQQYHDLNKLYERREKKGHVNACIPHMVCLAGSNKKKKNIKWSNDTVVTSECFVIYVTLLWSFVDFHLDYTDSHSIHMKKKLRCCWKCVCFYDRLHAFLLLT